MPCAFFRFSFFLIPPTFDGERDVRAALPFFSLLLLRTLDTALIRRMRSSSASNGSALAIESICSNRSDMSAAAVAGASCVFPGPQTSPLASGTCTPTLHAVSGKQADGRRRSRTVRTQPHSMKAAGRVAVVTGANKGIGYHIAASLIASKLFGTVILACRDPSRGERAAKELGGVFMPLCVGDAESTQRFAASLRDKYGRLDVLVNNAAIAFKAADPTPFHEQTRPTLAVNYYGTVAVTHALMPLLLASDADPRIVNVASMAGHLRQLSPERQKAFASKSLDMPKLDQLVGAFESDVAQGVDLKANGWGKSNYGFSKLALIASTKVHARLHPSLKVNAVCPGYCDTDMSSHRGPRSPADGAQNAVLLATMPRERCPSGEFYENLEPSTW